MALDVGEVVRRIMPVVQLPGPRDEASGRRHEGESLIAQEQRIGVDGADVDLVLAGREVGDAVGRVQEWQEGRGVEYERIGAKPTREDIAARAAVQPVVATEGIERVV